MYRGIQNNISYTVFSQSEIFCEESVWKIHETTAGKIHQFP